MKTLLTEDYPALWESQARQYPQRGAPGITHHLGVIEMAQINATSRTTGQVRKAGRILYEVDNLLYYSRQGRLVGILQYYSEDDPGGLEKAGNFNVWVHPRRHHRGIGTALLTEADRRWGPLNFDQQSLTPAAEALNASYLRSRS